jgi:F-type H+-transporting ATPase subunit a
MTASLQLLAAADTAHAAAHAASSTGEKSAAQKIAELGAELPFKVWDHVQMGEGVLVITNHMILLVLSAIILLVVMLPLAGAYKSRLVPRGFYQFLEVVMMWLQDEIVRPLLGKDTAKFMPYLWTLFFFILINNLLGLLPLYELTLALKLVGGYPIYGTATGNVLVNAMLAATVFLVIQYYGIKQNGIKGYLAHLTAGTPAFIWPVMVPVEILGMFVKPIALTMRLFANMLAGSLVLKVFAMFVAIGLIMGGVATAVGVAIPVVLLSVAMMLLKLFVGFLQAFLFMFLSTLFIAQQQAHTEHGHDEHHGHGGHGGDHGHAVAAH